MEILSESNIPVELEQVYEQLTQLREEVEQLKARVAELEGAPRIKSSKLPRPVKIEGFGGVQVDGIQLPNGEICVNKKNTILYLGVSKNTGFDIFKEWDKEKKLKIRKLGHSNDDFINLSTLEEMLEKLYPID